MPPPGTDPIRCREFNDICCCRCSSAHDLTPMWSKLRVGERAEHRHLSSVAVLFSEKIGAHEQLSSLSFDYHGPSSICPDVVRNVLYSLSRQTFVHYKSLQLRIFCTTRRERLHKRYRPRRRPSARKGKVRRQVRSPYGRVDNPGLIRSLYTLSDLSDRLFCAPHRHYKRPEFTRALLDILRKLYIPGWSSKERATESVVVHKVSGALTNAVFFVSCPSVPSARTLLLRIYGSSSGSLISRPRELHVLHVLSSRYNIGPRVYGTFENGRVEEYFDSVTLTATDIRQPEISAWIGARMAELHSVDIATVEGSHWRPDNDDHGWEIASNVRSWLGPAKAVLDLAVVPDNVRKQIDLDRFKLEWTRYVDWMVKQKHTYGQRHVFGHNDAQYGNLLRLKDSSEGLDEHRQVRPCSFLLDIDSRY